MPLAGQNLFGFRIGLAGAMPTLILNLVYGAVVGLAYASQKDGAAIADVQPS